MPVRESGNPPISGQVHSVLQEKEYQKWDWMSIGRPRAKPGSLLAHAMRGNPATAFPI